MTDQPAVLLVASGNETYRRYLLAGLAADHEVFLVHHQPPSWERELIRDAVTVAETCDSKEMVAAIAERWGRQTFAGVVCWDEMRIEAASAVAGALGLRNGDSAVLHRLRDKALTRQAVAAAELDQPRSEPATSIEEAVRAAERIGYPVVVKPRSLGGSLGVVRVEDEAGLRAHFAFAAEARLRESTNLGVELLIEQFIDGPEISIDAVVQGGAVTPIFVARKQLGFAPYFEETGHLVDAQDPLLTDPTFRRQLAAVHTALGVVDLWTHSEFRFSAGKAYLIEVNGRPGGDMIPYLGQRATGLNPGDLLGRIACGRPVTSRPERAAAAGVRFFYPSGPDTRIDRVRFTNLAHDTEAIGLVRSGGRYSPPPGGLVWGRIAMAMQVGAVSVVRDVLDRIEVIPVVDADG